MRRLLRIAFNGLTVLSVVLAVLLLILPEEVHLGPWRFYSKYGETWIWKYTRPAVDFQWRTGSVFTVLLVLPITWLIVRCGVQLESAYVRRLAIRSGLCPNCGYDLRATADRCPKCGTPKAR